MTPDEYTAAMFREADLSRLTSRGVPLGAAADVVTGITGAGEPWSPSRGVMEALKAARRGDRWVVLAGPVGTGKTTAAAWVCHQIMLDLPWHARWVAARDVGALPEWDREELPHLLRAHLLVVDDLGTESRVDMLKVLLERRDGSAGTTIVTTNLSGQEIRDRFGERVYSRMAQHPPITLRHCYRKRAEGWK